MEESGLNNEIDFYTEFVKVRCNDNKEFADKEPIYLNMVYEKSSGLAYSRCGSKNSTRLKKTFAKLYGVEDHLCGVATNFMYIMKIILDQLVSKNGHIIVADDMYREIKNVIKFYYKDKIEADFIDIDNYDELRSKIKDNTKAIIFEPSGNPIGNMHNIKEISDIVKSVNNEIKIIIDNTLFSIINKNPLKDGADIVIESFTKYYNGSGDVLGGLIVGENINHELSSFGGVLDPLSSWLITRGLTTYPLRLDRIQKTSKVVYNYLTSLNIKTHYIGVGGIVIFTFDSEEKNRKFYSSIKDLYTGNSFGQENTLVKINDDFDNKTDDWPGFLRISIGLESPEYIIKCLDKTIKRAKI